MNSQSTWRLFQQTVNEFMEDKVLRLSAALAYYSIFSIGPLLVLVIGIAGLVWGAESVRQQVGQQLQGVFGEKSAAMVKSMMTAQKGGEGLLATVVGGVALVFGATGLFGQLQDALNTIWGVMSKPGQGVWGFVRQRFLSMAMVLGTGFLLLVSMALSAMVNSFSGYLGNVLSLPGWVWRVLEFVLSLGVVTLLFALIFKVLPDVRIRWRDVWTGALGTAALFVIGKFLLGVYLHHESSASAYGAGSALIVIIMYVYYASVILFFGAEFTQVYARRHGRGLEPTKNAVLLTEEQRAQQGIPKEETVKERARRSERAPKPEPRGVSRREDEDQTRVE